MKIMFLLIPHFCFCFGKQKFINMSRRLFNELKSDGLLQWRLPLNEGSG